MLPSVQKFSDGNTQQLADRVKMLLSNVSLDNFKGVVVSGMTASVAGDSGVFKHGLKGQPAGVFILEGNAYVARNGVGPETVDVRSNATSQEFLAYVFR